MIDDYKEEFNRKQLHIDALYDYIDKLQNNKADKNDWSVEMNIKADKIALDNKVNMSNSTTSWKTSQINNQVNRRSNNTNWDTT